MNVYPNGKPSKEAGNRAGDFGKFGTYPESQFARGVYQASADGSPFKITERMFSISWFVATTIDIVKTKHSGSERVVIDFDEQPFAEELPNDVVAKFLVGQTKHINGHKAVEYRVPVGAKPLIGVLSEDAIVGQREKLYEVFLTLTSGVEDEKTVQNLLARTFVDPEDEALMILPPHNSVEYTQGEFNVDNNS